ncbi:MAG: 50S ribosomal protein L24 [Desulfuromonadales bacterium C00003068]|jgi:large subunit ribosomal protein L24|nr:MAG: 50S ribosomal protein L24 [Desulfuromonadales bacterium C00003068]
MAVKKFHVKKGDLVQVMAGKEKGKQGKVLQVFFTKNRLTVENLNIVKRHTRPSRQNQEGGIVEKEAAIAASNVMIVCSSCNKPTRTGLRTLEDGTRVRSCKKCNETVDR